MIWGLCLLCLVGGLRAAWAGPVKKTPLKTEAKAPPLPPQEQINLLMFGVLQFSDSMKRVYESTEANLAEIAQTLKSREGTLRNLGRRTQQAAEVGEQMREVMRLLQVRNENGEKCGQTFLMWCNRAPQRDNRWESEPERRSN